MDILGGAIDFSKGRRSMEAAMRLFLSLLLLSTALWAQTQTKIHVEHQGDDSVGTRFAFAFKEAVQKSASFVLVDERQNALNVDIATEDAWIDGVQLQPPKGTASYLSVAIWINAPAADCPNAPHEVFVEHKLSVAGSGRVEDAAQGLLAHIDKIMTALKKIPAKGAAR
jgi:hypothetical protein